MVEKTGGWHGWLWRIRLAEARAEIALARRDWEQTVRWADETITRCRAHGRRKYEALGLWTRGRALVALGRKAEALSGVQTALGLARTMEDPAMFVRVGAAWLEIDGDSGLLGEVLAATERIRANLPNQQMRDRFEAAEPVRLVTKSAGQLQSR